MQNSSNPNSEGPTKPPKRFLKKGLLTFASCMALAEEVFAQSTNLPWTQAVQAFAKPDDWLRLDSRQSKAIDSALRWHRLWEPIYSWQDERACSDDDWTNCLGVSDTRRFADFVLSACRENWGALLFAEESRAQSKGRFRDFPDCVKVRWAATSKRLSDVGVRPRQAADHFSGTGGKGGFRPGRLSLAYYYQVLTTLPTVMHA